MLPLCRPLALVAALALCPGAFAADTAVPQQAAPAAMLPAGPDVEALDRKLKENSRRIGALSQKVGSLFVSYRKGGVVGDVVQLPLAQLGAVNTGDTLDKQFIASSRKGYLFSWPDGGKIYLGGTSYFSGEGCTGQRYIRYELLPHAAQFLGAVFEEGGKVLMVPPRREGNVVIRSSRDGASCVDSQDNGQGLGPVLPNVQSVSGVPGVTPFAVEFRLSAQ